MKHLIFKDSSSESNMNHQIQDGLATINSILSQYAKTNLPPIQDKSTLQALMANPVTYIGKHLQDATNLSGWKVSHTKLVELLDEPEIKTLLHMANQATGQPIFYAATYGKLTRSGLEIDTQAWEKYVDNNCSHYAESKREIAAYEAVQKLIDAVETLHSLGMKKEHLVTTPLNATLLKYQGESNPIVINLHGFNQLAKV